MIFKGVYSLYYSVGGICEYHFSGHCYKYFDSASTLTAADDLCASNDLQGYIVEVGSDDENEFVFGVLTGMKIIF